MKRLITLAAMAMLVTMAAAQIDEMQLSCTSICAGRNATTDGSVITTHTCDGHYRSWMEIVPAKDYEKDTVLAIRERDKNTSTAAEVQNLPERGRIPQVRHTNRYINTGYPCLNEYQLGIGETTMMGRDTLMNPKGMLQIEDLCRLALERCKTAKEAIRLMGQLVKKYGYGDTGECLTIADPNEVWFFEVFGEGPKKIGGVWAAQRVPDGEVAVSANICRIGVIDFADTTNFLYSDNITTVARKLGFWDGKTPFNFWKAYAGENYLHEKKNYSIREWFIMNSLAPSLGLTQDMEELPFSVKPDHKVSVWEVSHLLGSYYEGTEWDLSARLMVPNTRKQTVQIDGKDSIPDLILSPRANPWMRGDETAVYAQLGDTAFRQWIRTVSVTFCAYSTIIQLRSWLPDSIGGIVWMGLDNPGQSPRFPIFAGCTELPKLLTVSGNNGYREDAALWRFRRTNRLASLKWGLCRKTMEPAVSYFEKKCQRDLDWVESAWKGQPENERADFLNNYVSDTFSAQLQRWDDMYAKFWNYYWAGF